MSDIEFDNAINRMFFAFAFCAFLFWMYKYDRDNFQNYIEKHAEACCKENEACLDHIDDHLKDCYVKSYFNTIDGAVFHYTTYIPCMNKDSYFDFYFDEQLQPTQTVDINFALGTL